MRRNNLASASCFVALGLCLVSCRTAPPVFSEIPPTKIEPEIATQEVRGPYVEIAGVRPGVQSEAIATVLIPALNRTNVLSITGRDADVRCCAKEAATWILNGDIVSISLAGKSSEEIEHTLKDLRDVGLKVRLSE